MKKKRTARDGGSTGVSTVRPQNRHLRPPWPKGVSGNPSGQTKTRILSQAYREALEQLDAKGRKTLAEIIARAVIAQARRGNIKAAIELADRTEGKAPQEFAINAAIRQARSLSDAELAQAIQERLDEFAALESGRALRAD